MEMDWFAYEEQDLQRSHARSDGGELCKNSEILSLQ